MTSRLSREHWPHAQGASAQAEALRRRVAVLAKADAEVYARAVEALRDRTEGAPGSGDEALGEALAAAAAIPLQIAQAGADTCELAADAAENCEPDLRGDAVAAALFAEAATRAAARLVEINLATTEADARVGHARELVARSRTATERALAVNP
jgi:formiminotetrahydrofolate cyclodeaminase